MHCICSDLRLVDLNTIHYRLAVQVMLGAGVFKTARFGGQGRWGHRELSKVEPTDNGPPPFPRGWGALCLKQWNWVCQFQIAPWLLKGCSGLVLNHVTVTVQQ